VNFCGDLRNLFLIDQVQADFTTGVRCSTLGWLPRRKVRGQNQQQFQNQQQLLWARVFRFGSEHKNLALKPAIFTSIRRAFIPKTIVPLSACRRGHGQQVCEFGLRKLISLFPQWQAFLD
jgi:hypothetical protein